MENAKRILIPGLIALVLIAGGAAGWFYKQLSVVKKNPQAAAQKMTAELVSKVSQLIVLPEGETPTIATVTDIEKLKSQPFFAQAKNGFNLLIYTTAKKVILYDPVRDRIIEVAPLNIGASSGAPAKTETPPEASKAKE